MNKIYQNDFGITTGNCMQAAYASLFSVPLHEVPHFVDHPNWRLKLREFYESHGYRLCFREKNPALFDVFDFAVHGWETKPTQNGFEMITQFEGMNGLFAAAVFSPTYFDPSKNNFTMHQVIIDRNFNVVHDPNPNNQGIKRYPMAGEVGYNGIIEIELIRTL